MSWGALGNALIGGHQAFRVAVADQEERARREELDRRYQEEQSYRASRDRIGDERYNAQFALEKQRDAEARADRTLNRAVQAFEFAQPYGGELGQEQADVLRDAGYGAGLESRQRLGQQDGFGAFAASVAGGGIAPESVEGSANFTKLTPEQEAAREAQRLALDLKRREEARQQAWDVASKQLDWGNPSRALGQLTGQAGSIEEAAKLLGLADDLRTNAAQRGSIAANTRLANARANDPDMTMAGGGGRAPASKPSVGASITKDPEFATLVDTYYREMGGLIDNALGAWGKGAFLANPQGQGDFMKHYFGQAQQGQTAALDNAIAKAAQAYQAQGRTLPPDVAARKAAVPPDAGDAPPHRTYRQHLQNGASVAAPPIGENY